MLHGTDNGWVHRVQRKRERSECPGTTSRSVPVQSYRDAAASSSTPALLWLQVLLSAKPYLLCCLRQSIPFASKRVVVMSSMYLCLPRPGVGATAAEPTGPWCVWVSVRLEMKAWGAGECDGTVRTAHLERVQESLGSKTDKCQNEAKIKDRP